MKRSAFLRTLAIIATFIPWCCNLPYMISAWHTSPLDHNDWLFLPPAIGFFIYVIARKREDREDNGCDWLTILTLLFSAILLAGSSFYAIHMLCIIGSAILAWALLRIIVGRAKAKYLIFPFAILLLATTSSTYWLSVLLNVPVQYVFGGKLLAGLGFAVCTFLPLSFRLEPLAFAAAVLVAVFVNARMNTFSYVYPPLLPDITAHPLRGNYETRAIPSQSATLEQFFKDSVITTFLFANDDNTFMVSAVACGPDIHEIHPTGHCLKSSGALMLSDQLVPYIIHGKEYMLEEIFVIRGGNPELYVVWYSCQDFSIGNFLAFRNHWNRHTPWFTYQLVVKMDFLDLPTAHDHICRFLEDLLPEPPKNLEIQ